MRVAVAVVSVLTAVLAGLWLATREARTPRLRRTWGLTVCPTSPLTPPWIRRTTSCVRVKVFRCRVSHPDGFVCMTTQHRAMYALDCRGPFVGAPDDANLAHLFSYGTVNGAIPMSFTHTDAPLSPVDGLREDEAPMLPAGQRFEVGNATCIHTDDILLACRMADPVKGNGFVATGTGTTTFGRS